jgi:hypothetical protein
MALTPEQRAGITEVLNHKIRGCSSCGLNGTFQLVNEGVLLVPLGEVLSGRAVPVVALICSNCGYVQMHHVFKLGLGPLLGIVPAPDGGKQNA